VRASRLDLDNYNNDTEDGLHITATAGSWLAIVYGFGGLRYTDDALMLNPTLPKAWQHYAFNLYYRGTTLRVMVDKTHVTLTHQSGSDMTINLYGIDEPLAANSETKIKRKK